MVNQNHQVKMINGRLVLKKTNPTSLKAFFRIAILILTRRRNLLKMKQSVK
jgi:hypothetical protein